MLKKPKKTTRGGQASPPSSTVPASPPSATLIPQNPKSPGYSTRPVVGGIQGPALYGTADQINTPAYQEKVGEAEGIKAAQEQLKQQKALLAAIRAGSGSGDGLSAAERRRIAEEKAKKKSLTGIAGDIRQILDSGSYGSQYDTLLNDLTTTANTARGTIDTGYTNLKNLISNQSNPYAGMQFKAAETNPVLSQFLQSQGGDVNALQQRVDAENLASQKSNSQFQNIADLLSARQVSGSSQRGVDAEAARLAALQDLGSQQRNVDFSLRQQKDAERERLNKILMELATQGIDVGGLGAYGLPPSGGRKK